MIRRTTIEHKASALQRAIGAMPDAASVRFPSKPEADPLSLYEEQLRRAMRALIVDVGLEMDAEYGDRGLMWDPYTDEPHYDLFAQSCDPPGSPRPL
jgi:hypothetical protein